MASMPLLDAASISCTSSDAPDVIARQLSQVSHGSPSIGFSQLSALARMRRRGGLAGAAGPAEQVGVADAVVAHRVA